MGEARAILLFDIDGTLLRGDGAGKRAMAQAFEAALSRGADGLEQVRFHGNTDRAIVREALAALGSSCSEADIDRVLAAYLRALEAEVASVSPFRALPGAHALLARLADEEARFAIGLGTGNVRAAAELKLASVGLGRYFAFGGFGCDAERREDLVAVGARRGAERLGVAPGSVPVVVIGDTVRDVACARAIGASVLAVATGGASADELAEARPDALVTTLEEPRALAMLLATQRK